MFTTASVPDFELPETDDRSSLLTSVFSVTTVLSGLGCYILGSYAIPIIEAAGLNGLVVYVLLFLGGLLGLLISLAPLSKPALVERRSMPIEG